MVYLSRIYTRSGDQGETGLGDGSRISKVHPRVMAMGDVDELNATLGLAIHAARDHSSVAELSRIQNELFDLGADLCLPEREDMAAGSVLRMSAGQTDWLEKAIDRWNEQLEPLKSFILPGGSEMSTWLHLARTICRRAERSVLVLHAVEPLNAHLLTYLNRLSDYLFVLARIGNRNGNGDVLWVPGASR